MWSTRSLGRVCMRTAGRGIVIDDPIPVCRVKPSLGLGLFSGGKFTYLLILTYLRPSPFLTLSDPYQALGPGAK